MNKIMTCVDGSKLTFTVCDYATWASNKLKAPIEFLHILDKDQYPKEQNLSGNIGLGSREQLLEELVNLEEQRYKIALEQSRIILEEAERYVLTKGANDLETRQRYGSLVETLAELEPEYQLLILGRQGEKTQSNNQHIGSQLETVIRTIAKPILITSSSYTEPKSIMVAFDGSNNSEKCIATLINNPLLASLPVHIVTVGLNIEDKLLAAKSKLEANNITAHIAILAGEVETALNEYQQQHDVNLLLMGAYGHSRIRQFFVGSTTTNMLQNAQIPVLLVR